MPTAMDKKVVMAVLGWTGRFEKWYLCFRKEVNEYVATHKIRGQLDYGKDRWKTFMNKMVKDSDFYIMKEQYKRGDKEVVRRTDLLLQDICKQYVQRMNRSKRKLEEALRDDGDPSGDDAGVGPSSSSSKRVRADTDTKWSKAVVLYLVDPEVDPTTAGGAGHPKTTDGKFAWCGESEIGVLYEPTLKEVWQLFEKYVPEGRHIREIWGAMDAPTPDAGGHNVPQNTQYLDNSNKIDAFFQLTRSQPIYLLGALSTLEGPNRRANTPPPARRPYIDHKQFEPRGTYTDPASDSEAEYRRRAGQAPRRFPRKDEEFERRIRKLRLRIKALENTKDQLKTEHKKKFPDAIHSDDEGAFYHMFFPRANRDDTDLPVGAADFISRRAQAREDATIAYAAAGGRARWIMPDIEAREEEEGMLGEWGFVNFV
jgi:hypothetical protein